MVIQRCMHECTRVMLRSILDVRCHGLTKLARPGVRAPNAPHATRTSMHIKQCLDGGLNRNLAVHCEQVFGQLAALQRIVFVLNGVFF